MFWLVVLHKMALALIVKKYIVVTLRDYRILYGHALIQFAPFQHLRLNVHFEAPRLRDNVHLSFVSR